jgi:hypothetical protein
VLHKDAWNSAWVTEQRDTNLRTVYDNYARGMANLVFALNSSRDPGVLAVDLGVSKADPLIQQRRQIVLPNATPQDRSTRLQIRFLAPGRYDLSLDGHPPQRRTHAELGAGLDLPVPANSLRRVSVRLVKAEPPQQPARRYHDRTTYLSDLEPLEAQRGTGLPQPVFRQDRTIDDHELRLAGTTHRKGLGCTANTVILYRLAGAYQNFHALVGVDDEVAAATDPKPSVFLHGPCR